MGRIITKVGDIYETIPVKRESRLLHFVAIDLINMNSDVVVVYKPHITLKEIEEAEFSPANVEFYTHTTLSQGVRQELWRKIGKASTPPLHLFPFKNFHGEEQREADQAAGIEIPVSYPYWTAWTPDEEDWRYLSANEGKKIAAEDGGIVPASDVIYRIEHGISEFAHVT